MGNRSYRKKVSCTAMTTAAKEIAKQALLLSEEDRHYVIEVLAGSMSRTVDPDVEDAWRIEYERRINDKEDGRVELIPAENLIQEMRRWMDEEMARSDRTEGKTRA